MDRYVARLMARYVDKRGREEELSGGWLGWNAGIQSFEDSEVTVKVRVMEDGE